jgi:uncharacterized delta-60 repeat protein
MPLKHSWRYVAGSLLSLYVLVMQQMISQGFVRADEATDLFFPIVEEVQEDTSSHEETIDILIDEEIWDEQSEVELPADEIDIALEVESDQETEEEWAGSADEEIEVEEVEETPPSAEVYEEAPTYTVIIAPEVGTPEEEIIIDTNLEEVIIDQWAEEESIAPEEEQMPIEALTSADEESIDHDVAGETWVQAVLNDTDTQEQEVMFTEPDTVITFDSEWRIDPTSVLSVYANALQPSSWLAWEIARQNMQLLLLAGGWEEIPELMPWSLQTIIDAWVRDLWLTEIDPGVLVDTVPTVSQLMQDTLFELYLQREVHDAMQFHKVIMFIGTDGELYVLDPYYGAQTDSPQLFTHYIASFADKTALHVYFKTAWYNPRTIEKTIAVPDEVIIKQENITVEIPQQEIHMEDQWGESDFAKIQDFTIEKLSATEFVLGESWAHLEFSEPIRVTLTIDLPEGTRVPLYVKHEWDESYTTNWLTTNPDADCVGGISSDESSTAVVNAGVIEFYSCGASTFMVDMSFGIGGSFNNTVNSVALQADGKIVVGGAFSGYNNVFANRIVRLLTWGGYDTGFDVWWGFNNTVNAVAVQADGKIVVGGAFTSYSGTAQNRITRLTSTWARDTTFVIGAWCNNTVNALAIQADGKIVVWWTFTTYAWVAQSRITRLSTTWARDTTFVLGAWFNGTVNSLAIQADGKIVVWGAFTTYAWVAQSRITRLSTTWARDTTFVVGTGFNNTVSALVIETGGSIVAAGAFTNYAGTAINRIIRLSTTWARDTSYVVWSAFNNTVSALSLQTDGKVIAWGTFTSYSWVAINRIIRLSTTGARDTTMGVWGGFNNTVSTLAIQTDGRVVAWWAFTTFNGFVENRFVRFYATWARDAELVVFGFNNSVTSMWIQTDGKVVVGGSFTNFSGTTQNRITRLTSTGVLDTTFTIWSAFNNTVNAVAVQADGKIVVWGTFTNYSGTAQNRITRLTSTWARDTTFVIGAWCNNTVNALAIQADGKIVVGGAFTTYAWVAQGRITRLSTTGARDATFVLWAWFNGIVNSLAIQADGKIVVWGAFTTYAWVAQSRITRLSTTWARDTTFVIGTGFDNTVNALALQADGKIVAWWAFTNYAGTPQNRITRLSTTWARDSTFVGTGFNGTVLSLGIQTDQKIVAGGSFTTYRGTAQNRITRINSLGDRDSAFSIGLWFDNTVNVLLIESPTTLLVGWLFLLFNNNNVQHGLTRLFMVPDPTIISPTSGEVVTSSTVTVIWTGQANGVITMTLSGSTKTGAISTTWWWSLIFTWMTNGMKTLSGFSDYAWNRSDIVTRSFTISLGTVTISAQTWWSITGLQTTNTWRQSEHQSSYFQVDDQKWHASGYYTTLSFADLTSTWGSTITSGRIEWKADPVVLLSGTANPLVTLWTGMTAYSYATWLVTFIKRDPSGTGGIFSTYGSQLWLRFTLPAYQAPGLYSGVITYTLYEN